MLRRVAARARDCRKPASSGSGEAPTERRSALPVAASVENLPSGAIGVRISASSESIFRCGVCTPI